VTIISNIIDRLAAFYRDDIRSRFPQYRHPRDEDTPSNTILVWKDSDILQPCTTGNGQLILMAEFRSDSVKIKCWKHAMSSVDFVDYADPRFTEDILSNRLAGYDDDVDAFMAVGIAHVAITPHYMSYMLNG